jgi:SAM-dependent methyltransferase
MDGKHSPVTEPPPSGLKEAACRYFQIHCDSYTERYLVPAAGDVFWPRHRTILHMVEEMGLPPGSRILDLGCGPGFLSFDLAKRGYRGVGIDAAQAMIQRCKVEAAAQGASGLWHYQVGDVELLPFPDESFDAAICAGVIEYLPGDESLLREVARVLKPGGRFIICFTNKYGYTISLSSLFGWIKRIPGARKAASTIRRVLVGGKHGATAFDFRPRKHRPSVARRTLSQVGYKIVSDRYAQFTLLPAPFCALASRLKLNLDDRLTRLDRTPLRIFGSCYLVGCRKT